LPQNHTTPSQKREVSSLGKHICSTPKRIPKAVGECPKSWEEYLLRLEEYLLPTGGIGNKPYLSPTNLPSLSTGIVWGWCLEGKKDLVGLSRKLHQLPIS